MRMPAGRYERRMAKTEFMELLLFGESPTPRVEAITENVSATGARVITSATYAPGELVRLEEPKEHLILPARVVCCQRLGENKFAVGLRLEGRVEKWRKASKP